MVCVELPDAITAQFLNKWFIRENSIQYPLLIVKHKLDEPLVNLQFAQIQKSVGTDRKNTLAVFRQGIKGPDLFCIVFL